MPRIEYVPKTFKGERLAIVQMADEIATDYERRGFDLTLRQLYYQFVSRDLIPNREESYKRLGSIVNDARLAGLIDWSMLKDRGREAHQTGWMGRQPAPQEDLVREAAERFLLDL